MKKWPWGTEGLLKAQKEWECGPEPHRKGGETKKPERETTMAPGTGTDVKQESRLLDAGFHRATAQTWPCTEPLGRSWKHCPNATIEIEVWHQKPGQIAVITDVNGRYHSHRDFADLEAAVDFAIERRHDRANF